MKNAALTNSVGNSFKSPGELQAIAQSLFDQLDGQFDDKKQMVEVVSNMIALICDQMKEDTPN